MSLFPNTLKLYHFFKNDSVSLSIKSSDIHVITFWMSHSIFQSMIKDSYSSDGFCGNNYFVLVKEHYVRFSKSSKQCFATHFRIEKNKWDTLVEQYNFKLEDNNCEHFAVEIA